MEKPEHNASQDALLRRIGESPRSGDVVTVGRLTLIVERVYDSSFGERMVMTTATRGNRGATRYYTLPQWGRLLAGDSVAADEQYADLIERAKREAVDAGA